MLMSKENLQLLARYNIWATTKLVHSLEAVSHEDFHKNIGLFFQSIAGTLNHLLLGEHYLWYQRFNAGVSPLIPLDTQIHQDKNLLLNELKEKSLHWVDYIESLEHSKIPENLTYNRANGQQMTLPFEATLIHVFNHGTHHRGQVSAAMTHLGYVCPELDLVYMLTELARK